MKILITGMTRVQTGESNTYVSFAPELVRALTELGHEVDWRPVKAGEELKDRYDFALVGLSSIIAFSAHYRFGAIWAASQLPTLHFHDDWGFQRYWSNYRVPTASMRRQGMDDFTWNELQTTIKERPWFEVFIQKWTADIRRGDVDLLTCMYEFGSEQHMRTLWPCRDFYRWDPSPRMVPMVPQACEKRRMWVCATLSNQDEWVDKRKYDWPVYRFYKAVGMSFNERLSEEDLFKRHFAPNWGALVYRQARLLHGGFWRPRHHLAMWAGMVQWGEAAEVWNIGPTWRTMLSEIEKLDDSGLQELAATQAADFTGHWRTPSECLTHLKQEIDRWMSRNMPS